MHLLRRLLPFPWGRTVAALLFCLSSGLRGQDPDATLEYTVKGAYLFKLAEYVDWPPKAFSAPTAPFVIGVLGQDPFGARLEQVVQNRSVQGHPIVIRRFKRVDQIQQAHVVYIAAGEWDRVEEIREGLRRRNILSVSEKDPRSEAIVSFVLQQGKVRFEIDLGAAERAELKLSSKLLGLAATVRRSGSPG